LRSEGIVGRRGIESDRSTGELSESRIDRIQEMLWQSVVGPIGKGFDILPRGFGEDELNEKFDERFSDSFVAM